MGSYVIYSKPVTLRLRNRCATARAGITIASLLVPPSLLVLLLQMHCCWCHHHGLISSTAALTITWPPPPPPLASPSHRRCWCHNRHWGSTAAAIVLVTIAATILREGMGEEPEDAEGGRKTRVCRPAGAITYHQSLRCKSAGSTQIGLKLPHRFQVIISVVLVFTIYL